MKKNKSLKIIILTLFFIQTALLGQVTDLKEITIAIKNADTKTIYESCENTISLSIPDVNGKFSKTQARQILDQFFKSHPATNVKALNTKSKPEQSNFSIIEYQTQNKIYNIFIQFKKVDRNFFIQIIQIQEIKS